MTSLQVLGICVGVVLIVGVPAMMIYAAVDHYRTPASKRRSNGATTGVVGAMVELDRITRPSVEHTIEAQTPIIRHEDESSD